MSNDAAAAPGSQGGVAKDTPKGFARMPHVVCADDKLSDADFRVLCALTSFVRGDGACWPSVKKIAKRAGDKSPRCVQRSLARLEAMGYVAIVPDPERKTGRLLRLDLKSASEMSPPPPSKVSPGGDRNDAGGVTLSSPKEEALKENQEEGPHGSNGATHSHREITLFPADGVPPPLEGDLPDEATIVGAWLDVQKRVHGRLEALTTAPPGKRGHASTVDRFAREIARAFLDEHSLDCYRKLGWRVVRGEVVAGDVREAIDSTLAGLSTGRVNRRAAASPSSQRRRSGS